MMSDFSKSEAPDKRPDWFRKSASDRPKVTV